MLQKAKNYTNNNDSEDWWCSENCATSAAIYKDADESLRNTGLGSSSGDL